MNTPTIAIEDPCMPYAEERIFECRLLANRVQKYYLYIPQTFTSQTRIFVSVHGISRNALEHATEFAPLAKRYGVILVAPYFPINEFDGYQRLRQHGKRASDIALDQILDEVRSLTGSHSRKIYLFGYSGGAQFVHRYMMSHPQNVARVSIGAAGWYTFPDPAMDYPRGLNVTQKYDGLVFDPSLFLKVPAQVVVGERDLNHGEELNQSVKVTMQQGENRIERGQAWINAMRQASESYGLCTEYVFQTLSQCSHSFRKCMVKGNMGEEVFKFLFGEISGVYI